MRSSDPQIESTCNLCHSAEFTVLYPAGIAQIHQIVRCKACGLMYANPRGDADCIEMQTWPVDSNWDLEKESRWRFEKERLQVRDFANSRALLNRLHPRRGRLVEVGSSMGFLLDTFRKDGWEVIGVDPDPNACRYAVKKMGLEAINSTLEQAKLPAESVDAVIMLHVIEHVPDPMGTLREIHRILKTGAHLIVETPRYDTVMFRLLGRRERSLSCRGHIFFFTTETLRRAYTAAGFHLVRLGRSGRSLTLDRLLYNVGVMSKSPSVCRAIGSLSRWARLNKLNLTINVGDIQRVFLAKPVSQAEDEGQGLS